MMNRFCVVYEPVKHRYTLRSTAMGGRTLAMFLQSDYLRSDFKDALSFEQCAQLYFFPILIREAVDCK